jgi:hypothetical protein
MTGGEEARESSAEIVGVGDFEDGEHAPGADDVP